MINIPITYRLPVFSLKRAACFSCNVMKNGSAWKNLEGILQDRAWLLDAPDSRLTTVKSGKDSSFIVIRDDLLHPFVSGNKMRKLDGLWPELVKRGVKDVITCGGLQSAHLLAVAALAAQHGMRSHLLVRGNRPDVLTGNHLFAKLFSSTTVYVSRSEYADREEMFRKYASSALGYHDVLSDDGSTQVAILPEGGALVSALLGMIRLVNWLAFRLETLDIEGIRYENSRIIVDSGTGTTAIGLALGVALLDLPWKVVGVILAAPEEYYNHQKEKLIKEFCSKANIGIEVLDRVNESLCWVVRRHPRKFGKVLSNEISACQEIASRHGILLDPIWTLSSWERATTDSQELKENVFMLHTGGALGMCGLAQRYPDQF